MGSEMCIRDSLFTSNGLAFSGDGSVMYVSDSNAAIQTIWAYDYDLASGTPTGERVFFNCTSIDGRPDGATVDSDGCYWTALFGGWQVARITPDGVIDRTINLPVANPTKPMFGSAGLDVLYVTSAGEGLGWAMIRHSRMQDVFLPFQALVSQACRRRAIPAPDQ